MILTRYFIISPRPELIECVAQVDAEGAELLGNIQVWSINYSMRATPGNLDIVLSIKMKLGYLLQLADYYGLAHPEDTAFRNEVRRRTGWPHLNIESFDRNWELSYTDDGVFPLEESGEDLVRGLNSTTLQLPPDLAPEEKECVESWIDRLKKSHLPELRHSE